MAVLARQQREVRQGVLVPPGGPLLGQEYFRIYDQTGVLWAWWIAEELAPHWGLVPEKTFDQEVTLHIIPWWLKLSDSDAFVWYVYPDVDGAPLVDISPPVNGEGIGNSPKLRAKNGRTRYQYTIVGGDIDVKAT